jgi:hypothetical protein
MIARLAMALVLVTAALTAQTRDGKGTDVELARSQRLLQQSKAEAERLLDLRLRHDLGLPTEDSERLFRTSAPVGTEAMERMQQELRDTDAENQNQRQRFNELKAAVEQLRAEAAARAQREQDDAVQVPTPGSVVVPRPRRQPASAGENVSPTLPPGADAPFPLAETASAPPAAATELVAVTKELDPMRATITGSTDHQRVATSLFRAGQALIERGAVAREQGQPELAKELEERGKDKLLRAVDELAPLLQAKEPPYEALFYLGRCREMLFRHDEQHAGLSMAKAARDYQKREQEVRDPFLQITARDIKKTGARGDIEVLGPWGMAAQTATEHFRWMNLNASYDATAAIAALRWPGDGEQ